LWESSARGVWGRRWREPLAGPAATKPKPAGAEPLAQNLPQEFEGLKFPNDGVLTRQWMEFLNQMASSK